MPSRAPDARVLSIDINHRKLQNAVFPCFRRDSQRISCMAADSHSRETLAHVLAWLAGDQLDFLFIDGDHSLAGVQSDYEMYAPLVRHGGVVAFHDIVPDFRTRYGTPTGCDVGQVPQYWHDLKSRVGQCEEYIEDANQDGYGIGVLRWNGRGGSSPMQR